MDWIEKLFGISPDGGDGSTEMLIVAVAVVILAMVLMMRYGPLRDYARRTFGRRE
jgi:hypothetical protein